MTHLALHPLRSTTMAGPLPGLLALLAAFLLTLLIPATTLANNDNDCVQKINAQISAIDHRLSHMLLTQAEVMSELIPLLQEEGACLTCEQRQQFQERVRSTDTMRIVLSIGTLALEINACHENGDHTDEQYTAALLRLESLLVTTGRISAIQSMLLGMLAGIPECD